MTQLSRLASLGIAKETVVNTWLTPTMSIPFTKADFEDVNASIKDESVRADDTVLHGVYQGPTYATWSIECMTYPDLLGHYLRGCIGPDTVTAGIATTLSSSSSAGATSLSTAASIAANSIIRIDIGAGLQEYAKVTAVSGAGPYTLTVTTSATGSVGLAYAHTSGVAVVAQSTHAFAQSANPATKATYSLTVYDTTQPLSYSGGVLGDLQIKVDPKGAVTASVKYTTMPFVVQGAPVTPSYNQLQPLLGWQWTMTSGGLTSTRGLSYDLTIKRAVDPINSSDGTQAPREIFQGALEVDASYKAIFENQLDLGLYLNNTQMPAVATLTQPIAVGGHTLTLTMSQSAWTKGKREFGSSYVESAYSISGVYNATDGGAVAATLKNFQSTAY
ncbi:phage tail tube protein [Embleya sp. NPDC005971]|uniref:phage tail tube protein n=1 Tax=Embleya sp. NPDC005971 TaxID=3156724 RepID=UPI003406F5F5